MISLREQFLVREMESEGAAPSAGAADRHELAGAFDNVILDLRSSKGLATQPGGGPIAADKVGGPIASAVSTLSVLLHLCVCCEPYPLTCPTGRREEECSCFTVCFLRLTYCLCGLWVLCAACCVCAVCVLCAVCTCCVLY